MITMRQSLKHEGKSIYQQTKIRLPVHIAFFILLLLTMLFYTQTVMFEDQELTALLITCYCFIALYAGRYIALLWAARLRSIHNWIYVALLSIIVVCLLWVLLHPQYLSSTNGFLPILLFALPLSLASLSAGVVVKLARLHVQKQLDSAKAMAEHSQSELQLLQSQLSPHFLFNTLNNMYGLSITKPEKVPSLLLKLSDLLRYSVYEVRERYVPLKSEIAYIVNYIEFEKIRIGERLVLTTSIEQIEEEYVKIAPMLLIVYVENAFKHAKNTTQDHLFVDINLQVKENYLFFSVTNSYSADNLERNSLKKHSGLGLANAERRLNLLYKDAYTLNIDSQRGTYCVELQLKVN